MTSKKEEMASSAQQDRLHLLQRKQDLEELQREDRATLRVQDAQQDLARSAAQSLSLQHGRDTERARHINAIYTEMKLSDVRQSEARDQTDKERLETVLKEATRDIVSETINVANTCTSSLILAVFIGRSHFKSLACVHRRNILMINLLFSVLSNVCAPLRARLLLFKISTSGFACRTCT